MEALELFAILVLAGAIVVLLYYYMQDVRSSSFSRAKTQISGIGEKATTGRWENGWNERKDVRHE